MKKVLSIIMALCVTLASYTFLFGVSVSASVDLSDEELAAKNYPVPEGYEVTSLITFDECDNKEAGTYYDTASKKIAINKAYSEYSVFSSATTLNGVGFMFWYKSDNSAIIRMRDTTKSGIIIEGTLPACSEGRWVTYYYYGKYINFNFKSDMKKDIRETLAQNPDHKYQLNIMFNSNGEKTAYIDEFYTFDAKRTPADTYDNDEQAYKFSLVRLEKQSNTIAKHFDDGSVELTSTYGSNVNNYPVDIYYNAEKEQMRKAIEIAKQGSGYLQIKCDNISCKKSDGSDAYGLINIKLLGIDKEIKKYSYGAGSFDIYLIDVSDVDNVDAFTGINVNISESIKDVDFKFSPITVFHFNSDEIIMQAENLNPKICNSSSVVDAKVYNDLDKNRTYIYNNDGTMKYFTFDLPKLDVGEYDVYASIYAVKNSNTKLNVSINNRRQLLDVTFCDENYDEKNHDSIINIGKIKITKDSKDGLSQLKFTRVPKCNISFCIDYFSFKKTDTAVSAEPSSNFEIKSYPEIENYELKTVLDTYDSFICSNDERYYKESIIAGYVGDGNAFNLNSRGTIKKQWLDNNVLWSNTSHPLDGDALRFWYKGGRAILQLRGNGKSYEYRIPAKNGEWVVVYYKDIVANGDLSMINTILLKPDTNDEDYVDEIHTIQQKLGDVKYKLNGDGTASVVGYNLRLEDVVIDSEYNGCPVTTIKEGALSNSLTIKSVKLPDSITKIEKGAFASDPNLKTVTFGNGVKTIEDNAFLNCTTLTDVSLPSSIESISNSAFEGCTSLYFNVTNDSKVKNYAIENNIDYKCTTENGIEYFCDYNEDNTTVNIIGYSGENSNLAIPSTIDGYSVVMLDSGCFENNTIIKTLTLPNSLVTVKDNALNNCTALESVEMPNVQTIGESAFYGCTSLKKVTVTNELLTIGRKAFYNDNLIEEFYFGDNITLIEDNAFFNCNFVAKLSDSAYESKDSYAYKFVNSNGFKNYPTTTSEFVYYIENYYATICGYKGSDAKVTVPAKIDGYDVQNIGESAFKDNTTLTSIKLSSVRNVEKNAFYGCSKLSSVTLSDSLRNISAYAFAYCSSLKTIEVNNVVTIDSNAFYGSPTQIVRLQTNFIRNSVDYVDGMTAGWNLGNTLDAHDTKYNYGDLTVSQSEHLWRKYDYISQDLFNMVAEKFNTIRIPITWHAFINPNNDYAIDKAYMDRIQEVVEMCYNAGFEYIIINTHHDSDYWFNPHPSNDIELGKYVLKRVWNQIGERFKDYDEKLIFESMNEIRSQGSDIGGNGDWNGNATLYDRYNQLNKTFFDEVRSQGGNNSKRYLMMQTYAGVRDDGQINSLSKWLTTTDGVKDDGHIIASTHWYIETMNENDYTHKIQMMKTNFVDKGFACVIGETGLPAHYDNNGNLTVYNDDYREKWVKFYFTMLEENSLKAIIWEDHGSYSTMLSNPYRWKFPKYVEAIYETTKKPETSITCKITIDGVEYVTVNKGNEVALPVSNAKNFVCYSSVNECFEPGEKVVLDKDLELTSVSLGSLQMLTGASMRLRTDDGGIRYYTKVDESAIENLKDLGLNVEFGTLIAPKDLLNNKQLTFDNVNVLDEGSRGGSFNALDVKYEANEYFQPNTFVGSISKVLSENVDREFIGRGYVKVTINNNEKIFYADYADGNIQNNTRTIRQIALSARNANSGDYSKFKSIIDYYADLK